MNETIKKRNTKLIFYISIFILAVVIILFDRLFSKDNIKNNSSNIDESNNKIIDVIKNIDDDYYACKAYMYLDDDAVTLEYEKKSIIEIGTKKYHNSLIEYIKKDDNYYSFNEGEFNKLDNFSDFNYDTTFIKLSNIKKILDFTSIDREYTLNNLNVLEKIYDTKDLLKIYNDYNNLNIIKYENNTTILNIYYKNDKINKIEINMTNLYNMINDTNKEKVMLELNFDNTKKEDIDWIIEKLN